MSPKVIPVPFPTFPEKWEASPATEACQGCGPQSYRPMEERAEDTAKRALAGPWDILEAS